MYEARRASRAVQLTIGVATVAMLAGLAPTAASATPQAAAPQAMVAVPQAVQFTDIANNDFRAEIQWLADRGVIRGWGDGTFRPLETARREQMAAFLYRLAGSPAYTPPAVSPFADVPTDHVFYTEIAWMAEEGISTGWSGPNGTRQFRPGRNVLRDQVAAFLYRLAGSPAYTPPAVSPFADVPTGHDFYTEIAWMAEEGISTGWSGPNGTRQFRPYQNVLRDQIAAFLHRHANRGAEGPAITIVDSTAEGGRTLALTFDDGPDPTQTPALLAVLKEHDVKATFCVVGDRIDDNPGVLQQIVADGHRLCNHSLHHDNFETGNWTAEQIRADLSGLNAKIRQEVPGASITHFRAPYGAWGESPAIASSLGMKPLGWRVDVEDWTDPAPTAAQVVARIEAAEEGAVVLLHDGGGQRDHTIDAVDQVIPKLKAEGWSFGRPA